MINHYFFVVLFKITIYSIIYLKIINYFPYLFPSTRTPLPPFRSTTFSPFLSNLTRDIFGKQNNDNNQPIFYFSFSFSLSHHHKIDQTTNHTIRKSSNFNKKLEVLASSMKIDNVQSLFFFVFYINFYLFFNLYLLKPKKIIVSIHYLSRSVEHKIDDFVKFEENFNGFCCSAELQKY